MPDKNPNENRLLDIFNFVEDYKDFIQRWNNQEHNGIQNGETSIQASTSAFFDSLVYISTKAVAEKSLKLSLYGGEKLGLDDYINEVFQSDAIKDIKSFSEFIGDGWNDLLDTFFILAESDRNFAIDTINTKIYFTDMELLYTKESLDGQSIEQSDVNRERFVNRIDSITVTNENGMTLNEITTKLNNIGLWNIKADGIAFLSDLETGSIVNNILIPAGEILDVPRFYNKLLEDNGDIIQSAVKANGNVLVKIKSEDGTIIQYNQNNNTNIVTKTYILSNGKVHSQEFDVLTGNEISTVKMPDDINSILSSDKYQSMIQQAEDYLDKSNQPSFKGEEGEVSTQKLETASIEVLDKKTENVIEIKTISNSTQALKIDENSKVTAFSQLASLLSIHTNNNLSLDHLAFANGFCSKEELIKAFKNNETIYTPTEHIILTDKNEEKVSTYIINNKEFTPVKAIQELKELSIQLTKQLEQNQEEKIQTLEKNFEEINSKTTLEEKLESLKEIQISKPLENFYSKQLIDQYQEKVIENQGIELTSLELLNLKIEKRTIPQTNEQKQEEKDYISFESSTTVQNNNSQIQTMS